MPLFQIGYRTYEGPRTPHLLRWLPITRSGLTIAWRSKMLRWLVTTSFLPFLYFGIVFFLIGRATSPDAVQDELTAAVVGEMLGPRLFEHLRNDPELVRTSVWSIVFAMFGTIPQLVIGFFVASIVGPPLVASDMRSRSFLVYFARPISRLDYVLGKGGVLVAALGAVSLLPSLLLYVLSILFSPSVETLIQTLPVVLEILLASIGAVVPATLVVLLLSSFTRQPRFATAAWVVFCTFGSLGHTILQQTSELRGNGWTFLLSFPHTIRALQLGVYDVEGHAKELGFSSQFDPVIANLTSSNSPLRAGVYLAVLSLVCFLLLLRRVDAPTRV